MKVLLNKDRLNELLDGRTYSWLLEKLNSGGINISGSSFYHILGNRNECRLLYAFGIAKLFNTTIEDIFFIEDQETS